MYRSEAPAAYWRDQLFLWGPRVLFAILILIVTHFVAKGVQWGVARGIDRMPVLKRHPQAGGESVGTELGRLAYWLVWLVGLIAALQPLGLSGVLTPVTNLTNEVFAFLPRLLGAGLFFFAGLILARVVRHVVEAFLGALNLERLLGRAGVSIGEAPLAVDETGVADRRRRPGAQLDRPRGRRHGLGDHHHLRRHRRPADPADRGHLRARRRRCCNPLLWPSRACSPPWSGWRSRSSSAAGSRRCSRPYCPSLGFDRSVHALGIMPASTNPSKVVGAIALTAILLAAAIEAARQLGGDSVAALLFQITELGGKVIFGTVIIVVGLFLARILAGLVGSSTGESGYRPDHRQICDHRSCSRRSA